MDANTARFFEQLTLLVAVGLLGPLLSAIPKLALTTVIGELLAGALIGTTGLHWIDASAQPFPLFYALGFAMLMLSAGTHINIGSPSLRAGLARGARAFAIVSVLAIGVGFALDRLAGLGRPALLSVLVAGSSAAVIFPMIEERRLRGASVRFMIAWVTIADAVTVVVMPLTLTGQGSLAMVLLGDVAVLVVGAATWVLLSRLRRSGVIHRVGELSIKRSWGLRLRISTLLLLGLSSIAAAAGASTLLAGFVAGAVLARLQDSERLGIQLIGLANGFFVPLFFVLLGAKLDFRALYGDPDALILVVAMLAGSLAIHVAAALVVAPRRHGWTSGLVASAQLGLPAAAASIGLQSRALSPAIAAAIVAAGCLSLIPATIGINRAGSRAAATRG
jgi:Kef-type K+ transport system membrane component KefB